MKLGYVVKNFPRLSETFILNELLGQQRLGCELTVLSRYRPAEPVPHAALKWLQADVHYMDELLQERFWEPFEIHRRLAKRRPKAHDRALSAALKYRSRRELRYWLLAARVAETALDLDLDLLHAHFATGSTSVARYASLITGIPYSFTAHAKDIYTDAVDQERVKDLMHGAAFVVTVSDFNVGHLEAITPDANIVRIYNGLDIDQIDCLPEPPNPEIPLLLSVSRFVEKKGLCDLISSVAQLRDEGRPVRCRLVGDGPLEDALRAQATELGLDDLVEFTGIASQEQVIQEHMPAASAFVLPCIVAADGDRDGLPTTLLESMARGLPVVTTRLPGIPEGVPENRCGLLADPHDVNGLTEAIKSTLDDREGTHKRVKAARQHVEDNFTTRRQADELFKQFTLAARNRIRAETGS